MTPFLNDFQFIRPFFLLLFVPLAFLLIALKRRISSFSSWERICDAPLLKYLVTGTTATSQKARLFWLLWTLFFAVIALSGPSFYKNKRPAALIQNPLMIVLNLENEMNRSDIRPSRLAHAKIEITDILQNSHASPSGLIVFTDEPFVITPLSEDANILINLLGAVQTDIMPLEGNRLGRAIDLAANRLSQSRQVQGHILVLSGQIKNQEETFEAAQKAYQQGFKVSVYNISLTDNPDLRRLAEIGGGEYSVFTDGKNTTISDFIASFNPKNFDISENETTVAEDNGWFFVFLSAFGLLYFFRKGAVLVLLFCMMAQSASAGFLFNADQEGIHAFRQQKYDTAAEKFQNPDWKAVSLYKAGDYDSSLKYLADKTDERSLYNKGNALAKSGDYQKAIQTYEEVLKINPQNEDARFNLEYLKQMEQNNQSSSSNNSSNQNEEEQQQKEQNQDQNQNENQDQNQEEQQNQEQNQEKQDQEQQALNQEQQNQEQNQEQQDQEQQQNQEQEQSQDSSSPSDNQKSQEEKERMNENNPDKKNESSKKQSQTEEEKQEGQSIPNNLDQKTETGEKDDKYDETIQARAQRFREIKEDTGGLLKALIKEEYLKKRY